MMIIAQTHHLLESRSLHGRFISNTNKYNKSLVNKKQTKQRYYITL